MKFGTVVLIALASWFGMQWVRGRAHHAREQRLPPGVRPMEPAVHAASPDQHEACMRSLRTFATEYRLTFQHGPGCGKGAVLSLHALRDEALRHMYQLRMRLPNDLHAETRMTQHIEDTDALLRAHIRDAQERCDAPMVYPGPIDDSFYKDKFRAHNDTAA